MDAQKFAEIAPPLAWIRVQCDVDMKDIRTQLDDFTNRVKTGTLNTDATVSEVTLKRWAAEFDEFQDSWFRSSGEVVAQEIELAPPDQRQLVTETWSNASGTVDNAKERAREYARGFIPLYKAANGDLQQFRDDIDTASAAFAKALDRVNLLLGYDIDRVVKQWYHLYGRST
jgi:hypothetical protein